tara:strand:+ start:468 stop:752 length:285 start_codon:yes stop_codon:yes gene_type:complete
MGSSGKDTEKAKVEGAVANPPVGGRSPHGSSVEVEADLQFIEAVCAKDPALRAFLTAEIEKYKKNREPDAAILGTNAHVNVQHGGSSGSRSGGK